MLCLRVTGRQLLSLLARLSACAKRCERGSTLKTAESCIYPPAHLELYVWKSFRLLILCHLIKLQTNYSPIYLPLSKYKHYRSHTSMHNHTCWAGRRPLSVCVCGPRCPLAPPPPVCQSGRHQISWCGQIDKQAGRLSSLEVPGARPPATHSPAPGASGCLHSIDFVSLCLSSHLLCFASWKHVGGDRKLHTVSATTLTPIKTVILASSLETAPEMDRMQDSRQNQRLASFVSANCRHIKLVRVSTIIPTFLRYMS